MAFQRALVLNVVVAAPQLVSERRPSSPSAASDLLGALPQEERDAVVLARSERVTYREVAAALGISEEVAKRRLRSGLQRLRAEMVRTGAAIA